jgi:hypothetical protein
MNSTVTTKRIATTRPWEASGWWVLVVAILIAALGFGVALTQGKTTSARSDESRALVDHSLSLPCRHQMGMFYEGPTCGGASAADVVATDAVRKPHGFGAPRPSRDNCLGLPRRGITCADY